MITFTKEQLIASAHARIEFAEMMLAGELEPLKERTWSIELELARIALASLEAEPVAWMWEIYGGGHMYAKIKPSSLDSTPLYAAPPAPVVPNGWVLVPVEPTHEMQSAAACAIRFDTTPINKLWTGNAVYRAMLAAAPQQEVKNG